jgi:hypothetical protein
MDSKNSLVLEELVGEKELAAYQTYLKLTSYENFILTNNPSAALNQDYSTRDMNFPLDIVIKE